MSHCSLPTPTAHWKEKLLGIFGAQNWIGELKIVQSDGLFTYVSGHCRAVSVFCFLRMAFDQKLPLPAWMGPMLHSVPAVVVDMSVPQRQIAGLCKAVEATVLARSFSYIGLVRLMDNLSMDVGQLKDRQSCGALTNLL